ncbi:MAG: DUF116 domain-containing protein [Patescibacteria group bacterium]
MLPHIESLNRANLQRFLAVPVSDRAIFISHCLRNIEGCQNKRKENGQGLLCQGCNDQCQIKQVIETAEKCGYQKEKIFIVSGQSVVKRLLTEHSLKAVVGIACPEELSSASRSFDLPKQIVCLKTLDCEMGSSVLLEDVKFILGQKAG